MGMLSHDQLVEMGFSELGDNVMISDKASIYSPELITIGSNVRIDDFVVLAAGVGGITIHSFVHIAVGATLIGAGNITLSQFSGLSSRVSIYSSSDDYSGETLTNPTVPEKFKNVVNADVFIGRHVIVGSGSVVLPGTTLEDGVAIAALSLVNKDCRSFGIYAGNPVKRISDRKQKLLELEKEFTSSLKANE
ncbi:MAG: acyltransferase [Gammaproteobacteria bacterium]